MAYRVTEITFPGFTANCYLVVDEDTNEAFLIDPGAYGIRQSEYIKSQGVNLRYILLTHGHYDHILGVKQFKEDFSAKVAIHPDDEDCLHSSLKSLAIIHRLKVCETDADILVTDGVKLPFGDTEIEVVHTPGHTKGSVCYKLGDMLFSGDTLFKDNIGRCDLPGGSLKVMLESMKKLKALQGDCKVYSGHGKPTTLEYERRNNPYMRGI